MAKQSAGLLLYRVVDNEVQVLLVHPGGPFFRNKDAGVWSIPKGEYTAEEEPLTAALREVKEELGIAPPGPYLALTPIIQKNGKRVTAWAAAHDFDERTIVSNTFPLEWPPRSGKMIEIPEVDKAGWFTAGEAKEKIIAAQFALVEELLLSLTN